MQRKYSEPNAYIDNLPKGRLQQDELYDDVDLPDLPVVRYMPCCRELWGTMANIWPWGVSSS